MPSFTAAFVTLAAVAGAVVAAPVAPVERGAPAGWAYGYLEPYGTYHTRYLALECQNQHNTTFFEDCCHPLLSTQSLADRPDYCTPNATQIAAAAANATSASVSASSAQADVASVYSVATSAAAASTSVVGDAAFASHTSVYVAPTTTSTYVAPKTTSTYVAPTTTAASSGGSGQTMTGGYATYFYQGGNAGECGTVHSDSEYGIAIDSNGWWADYASNSNSPYCGKQIRITNSNNGKSVTATVWDVCPTCVSSNSLDLSVGAFNAIASPSDGMVPITWQWA